MSPASSPETFWASFASRLTAYLLGTHSAADSLAVAIGPIDTLNQALINTIIFAFVPMLTERDRGRRASRCFSRSTVFSCRFFCA